MDLQKAKEIYKETSITTSPIMDLKIKMLKLCLVSVEEGKKAITEDNIIRRNESLQKSQQLMIECISVLNHGAESSASILQVYAYINQQLIEANIKGDISILDEVEAMLKKLLHAWEESNLLTRKKKTRRDFI